MMTILQDAPMETPTRDNVQRLRSGYAPAPLPGPDAMQALSALLRPVRLRKGEHLCSPGDGTHRIGWVDRGLMRSYHLDRAGKQFTKIFFTPDKWFITGFVTALPIEIGLQACVDTTVWVADLSRYHALLINNHDMAIAHIAVVYTHLVYKHEREVDLLALGSAERYLRFVQRFAQWIDDIPLSQIATHLGMTATQLSRVRKRLGATPRARKLSTPPSA